MSGTMRIEDVLREKGVYVSTTSGVSMYPMLRNRRDTIVIRPPEGRLKRYDVPLYRRGEAYVLHRIVEVRPDSYVICGDNCLYKEYGVTDSQIIGVLTAFCRDGRPISMEGRGYRLYVRLWTALYPARAPFMAAWRLAGKCRKRIRDRWISR